MASLGHSVTIGRELSSYLVTDDDQTSGTGLSHTRVSL